MVMTAGCAGWGTDSPADPDEETDGNGEVQTNESPDDDQETESDDSGTEEEQQGGEETSDTSTSTDSTEGSSSEANTDKTDANGPSETDDGETVDSTEETDTTDETETDSSQTDSDQSDESPSSNGGDDNGDGSPASGGNDENSGEEPSENGENGDSGESDSKDSDEDDSSLDDSQDPSEMTCDAFNTWDEAHSYFEEDMQERSHLDGDGDGIPCEHLKEGGDDDTQGETHNLTVEVYDSEGNPVEGADVSLTVYDSGAPIDEGTTDENGQVTFEVADGDYEVMVSGTEDAQETTDRGASVDGEDTTHVVNLIETGNNMYSYSATVQVVDEDGNPLTNERVEVSSPPGEQPVEYITDENGEFTIEFENSAEGDVVQHEVVVRDTSETIHIERGEQSEQITVSTDTDRETHTLTVNAGEVYPVEGVDVTIERHADGATTTKTTDEEGQVTFDVYPGDYTVTGVDEQGEEYSQEVTVDGDESVLLPHEVPPPEEVQTTLTVVDQDGNPVEGVTIEAMTSIPPQGADVYIQSEPTDENGQVVVEAHEGQTYGSVVVKDADGNQYDHGGQTFTTDGDGVTIIVERPREDTQQSLVAA